jgi:hypothetical protein
LHHDFQYGAVGFDHPLGAQAPDVFHGFLGGDTDDAVGVLNLDAMKREGDRLNGCASGRGELEGTSFTVRGLLRRFWAVSASTISPVRSTYPRLAMDRAMLAFCSTSRMAVLSFRLILLRQL